MTNQTRPIVTLDWEGAVATVTMNHEPHNLLGKKLLTPLLEALQKANDEGARSIILRSGLRHFCAGADLDLFAKPSTVPLSPNIESAANEPSQLRTMAVIDQISSISTPIIASIHGSCLGGGLELALICDYVIASRSAKFGCVEATLGLHPLMGAIQRIAQRAGEARAKEMAMLARRYDAATLERWNIINLVVADDKLAAATTALAKEFAAGPTVAHAATKRLAHIAINEGVEAADRAMDEVQAPIWSSADLQIGLTSFLTAGPGVAQFEGR